MKTISNTYRPKNQAECDHANALREYETAHMVWMSTSVFTEAGKEAKRNLCVAREKLTTAVKSAHPTWIIQ